jgi:hypothetical protein
MRARSCLLLQTPSIQRCLLHLPKGPSSGVATSRATALDRSGPISFASTPIGRRTASAPTSTSDRHCAATRRTRASTSDGLSRRRVNPEYTRPGVGPRMSKAEAANRETRVSDRPKAARIVSYFVVELACLLCNRDVGAFRSPTWPAPPSVQVTRPGKPPALVADWRQLRCENCGGNVLPSEIERHTVRIEKPIDWESDKPRRGRPPKRLLEQRSRAATG